MRRRDLLGSTALGAIMVSFPWAAWAGRFSVRVAMLATGPYSFYQLMLRWMVVELNRRALLHCPPLTVTLNGEESTKIQWHQFVEKCSGKICPVADGHYEGDYTSKGVAKAAEDLHHRIETRHDIDMVWIIGSAAAFAAKRLIHNVPLVVIDSTSSLESGLVPNMDDSGQDNLYVPLEYLRTDHVVRMFYELCRFRRLGVTYLRRQERSLNVPRIQAVCQEKGVPVVLRPFDCSDRTDIWFDHFFYEIKYMVEERGVDAIYLPFFPADDRQFDALVAYLTEHNIYSFASTEPDYVRRGILLGISESVFTDRCKVIATAIESILLGKKPRSIRMPYLCRPQFAVNLKTAAQVEWHTGPDSLISFDRVYTTTMHREFAGY